jgi:hypothetical protein
LKQSVNWYIATDITLLALFVLTVAACSQSTREPAKEGVCPTSAPIKRTINPIDAPKYNKDATPVIPPDYSRSVSIWRDGIPATPVACGPQITDYPERPFAGSLVLLKRVDIIVKRDGSVTWGDVEPTYVEFRPGCVD